MKAFDMAGEIARGIRDTGVGRVVFGPRKLRSPDSEGVGWTVCTEQWGNWPRAGRLQRLLLAFAESRTVDEAFLDLVCTAVKKAACGSALLVYSGRLRRHLSRLVEERQGITAVTFAQVTKSAIDADKYTKEWFPAHVPDRLEELYVERHDWKALPIGEMIGAQRALERGASLAEFVESWILDESDTSQLAVLAGAGVGKTWSCWHYCCRQMERYEEDPDRARLPLYLRLRDYGRFYSIADFVEAKLSELGVHVVGGYRGLRTFSRRFLLVMDGFDEMETLRTEAGLFRDFDEINRLIAPGSKLILSSRKVVFHEMSRIRFLFSPVEMIPAEAREYLLSVAPFASVSPHRRNPFRVVEVEPFTTDEVDAALAKRRMSRSSIAGGDVAELAAIPLLLDRLVPLFKGRRKALPKASVLEHLVQEWVRRPVREGRTAVRDVKLKVRFAEEFAWQMLVRSSLGPVTGLAYADFPWQLWEIVRRIGDDPLEDPDPVKDDLRTQTFLETDLEGNYRLTHSSLRDFFVARKLVSELLEGQVDNFGRFRLPFPCIQHVAELLEEPTVLWSAVRESARPDVEGFVSRWKPGARYLAANAVSVLAAAGESLQGADLRDLDLRSAALQGAHMTSCRLEGSDLSGAELSDADLTGTQVDGRTRAFQATGAAAFVSTLEEVPERVPYPPAEMVLIPGGSLRMGSGKAGNADEEPVHDATVSPFFMDIYEVTNSLYLKFVLERPEWDREEARKRIGNEYYLELWNGRDGGPRFESRFNDHPVVYVSWFAAVAYCNWRSGLEGLECCYQDLDAWYEYLAGGWVGRVDVDLVCNVEADGYRLPTEAEWEFVARGGHDQREYPWGEAFDETRVLPPEKYTAPVLREEPNEFGVSALVGNVREWCNDWYDPAYYASAPARNPPGPQRSEQVAQKVLRGGSVNRGPESHRCAFRSHVYPENTNVDAGFRCVRRLPAPFWEAYSADPSQPRE